MTDGPIDLDFPASWGDELKPEIAPPELPPPDPMESLRALDDLTPIWADLDDDENPHSEDRGVWAEDMTKLPPKIWLAQHIAALGEVTEVHAPTSQGKTFVAIDWSVRMALGKALFDRSDFSVDGPQRVAYFAGEGWSDFPARVRAAVKPYETSEWLPIKFYPYVPLVLDPDHPDSIENAFQEMNHIKTTSRMDGPFSVVILDTLSKATLGTSTLSEGKMVEAITKLQNLAQEHSCAVIIQHHTPRGSDRSRDHFGAGGIANNADTMISITYNERTNLGEIQSTKTRGSLTWGPFGFRLARDLVEDNARVEWLLDRPKSEDLDDGPTVTIETKILAIFDAAVDSHEGYTNSDLEELGCGVSASIRWATQQLTKRGLLKKIGKRGKAIIYQRNRGDE